MKLLLIAGITIFVTVLKVEYKDFDCVYTFKCVDEVKTDTLHIMSPCGIYAKGDTFTINTDSIN